MKEKDLSAIKRHPIVEYLERKGIKPVRRKPSYALYRSPLREETHPSFKVDTQKNLWIDYAEGRGGSIIDLCMRLEGCTLSEAIRRLGQNASDNGTYSSLNDFVPNNSQPVMAPNGSRRLIEISNTLPAHFQEYLTKVRCINLGKAMPFLKCISYEVRGQRYQAIGFVNSSGGYELRDNQSTNHCLVMNSVSNTDKAIRYMNTQGTSSIRTFLDNDDAGRKAVRDLCKAGLQVDDMSQYYKDFKYLNEYHVSRVRERQKHKRQIQAHMSITDQNQNKESKQVKLKMK